MRRRSQKSATPLISKKDELVLRESQLREEMQKLERVIADAPLVAAETTKRRRDEILRRANEGSSRLDVSIALQDKRYGDERSTPRRRGSLRKERREGRIVFLMLLIALSAVVIWLASHLHF